MKLREGAHDGRRSVVARFRCRWIPGGRPSIRPASGALFATVWISRWQTCLLTPHGRSIRIQRDLLKLIYLKLYLLTKPIRSLEFYSPTQRHRTLSILTRQKIIVSEDLYVRSPNRAANDQLRFVCLGLSLLRSASPLTRRWYDRD